MKKIQISATKGYFKEFNSVFMENDIRNRLTYVLQVDRVTHEQNIVFTPIAGDEISKEDFKTLMSIIP